MERAQLFCEDCTPDFARDMRDVGMCDRPEIVFKNCGADVKGCLPTLAKKRGQIIALVVEKRLRKLTKKKIVAELGPGKIQALLDWLVDDEALVEETNGESIVYVVDSDRMRELYEQEVEDGFF